MPALPPATLEGWYVLHQAFDIDYAGLRALAPDARRELVVDAQRLLAGLASPEGDGWSAGFRIVGGGTDLILLHFRPTLDALARVELQIKQAAIGDFLKPQYDFLSITEAGLYHATAEVAREHPAHSPPYQAALAEHMAAEAASPHIKTRLFPRPPEDMRYISFYPMTKRREGADNWYSLDVSERNRLMREHGLTGRRYAGKVFQVISGSVGFADWEWGVTLFARDPLEFKKIVTEMRYDEATARFGEFGRFFAGVRVGADDWPQLLSVA
jgi:chlorite dismutase